MLIEKILLLFAAYLVGSIPTGYLICKIFKKIDIRNFGSGNIGATNVLRTGGKTAAVFTLAVDFAKGFVPVILAKQRFVDLSPSGSLGGLFPLLVGCATILGHSRTIFLRFQGGKGVATGAGVFLAYLPLPALLTVILFLLLVGITGYVSVGSVVSAFFFPLNVWAFGYSLTTVLATVPVSIFIIFNHRNNLKRLIQGKENRFWKK